MCGIVGIIGESDLQLAESKIIKMNECLKHRGPDADGIYLKENIALGHKRLSIIDLSPESNQPFIDHSNRYLITFNGEIYNFQDIKRKLPDYPFKTDSDTEVILAAYEKFGIDFLQMLNGMFAFAIWDKKLKKLLVARDRLGVKPFYYSQTDDGKFIFASEIRAILQSGFVSKNLSKSGLHDYLMYQSVYSPNTMIEGISQLKAGEYGILDGSNFQTQSFWNIEDNRTILNDDRSQILKTVKQLLMESVERRMISDVPLGAFLSGGIDSSAIVALMSEVSTQKVNTFSVEFHEKEFDESIYAKLIAKKFKTNHTSVRLSANDFLEELPNALKSIDSPSGDGINTYVVSKATKNAGISVALSGLGGDELFAGYNNFKTWLKIKQGILPKTPYLLRKLPGYALSNSNNSKYQRLSGIFTANKIDISKIYPIFRQVLSPIKVEELLNTNGFDAEINILLSEKLAAIEKFPLLSQFSIGELLGYTQNVLLKDTDQFSMASALEVREPFFDYNLVEYVLRIPDEFKFPIYPKSLLVESIAPLLPDEIVHRKKMGFVLPFEKWMRNELKDFCEKRIENLAERRILNSDTLISQWKHFINNKNGVLWSHLWHLVVLSEWLENNEI